MIRRSWVCQALGVLGAQGAAIASLGEEPPETVAARQEMLRRLALEEGVVTKASSPGVGEYSRDLSEALMTAISDWLLSWVPGVGEVLAPLTPTILYGLLAVVAAMVIFFVARRWLAKSSASKRTEKTPSQVVLPSTPGRNGKTSDRWAETFERCLEQDQVAAALEALWWWLATEVSHGPADPTWTSRELLGQAQRSDLRPLADRLDRLMYGADAPRSEQVRALFEDLQGAVG